MKSQVMSVIAIAVAVVAGACTSVAPIVTDAAVAPTPIVIYVTPAPPTPAVVTASTQPSTPTVTTSATATPTHTTAPTPTPTPRVTPPPATPTPTPTATSSIDIDQILDPTYAVLAKREWQSLVRSPDEYDGDTYTVFGCISQFDTGTGSDSFRAQTSYKKERWWYLDGENVLFQALSADKVSDFFEGDVFRAQVVDLGSYTYDTTIGGSMTVPLFGIILGDITHLSGSC